MRGAIRAVGLGGFEFRYRIGALHRMQYASQGGFLRMHTDFNRHEKLLFDRRINTLYYLNKNWRPEYGGELLIQRLGAPQQKGIEPIFNRLVIFNTNDEHCTGIRTCFLSRPITFRQHSHV